MSDETSKAELGNMLGDFLGGEDSNKKDESTVVDNESVNESFNEDNHEEKETSVSMDVVSDDDKNFDEDLAEKEESNKDGADNDEKKYSSNDVSKILKKRIARIKSDSIRLKVEQETAAINKEKADLQKQLDSLRNDFDNLKNEKYVSDLAVETGVSAEILLKSNLKGDDLKDFAESLMNERKAWSSNVSADSVLGSAVLNSTKEKKENWRDALASQLKSDR